MDSSRIPSNRTAWLVSSFFQTQTPENELLNYLEHISFFSDKETRDFFDRTDIKVNYSDSLKTPKEIFQELFLSLYPERGSSRFLFLAENRNYYSDVIDYALNPPMFKSAYNTKRTLSLIFTQLHNIFDQHKINQANYEATVKWNEEEFLLEYSKLNVDEILKVDLSTIANFNSLVIQFENTRNKLNLFANSIDQVADIDFKRLKLSIVEEYNSKISLFKNHMVKGLKKSVYSDLDSIYKDFFSDDSEYQLSKVNQRLVLNIVPLKSKRLLNLVYILKYVENCVVTLEQFISAKYNANTLQSLGFVSASALSLESGVSLCLMKNTLEEIKETLRLQVKEYTNNTYDFEEILTEFIMGLSNEGVLLDSIQSCENVSDLLKAFRIVSNFQFKRNSMLHSAEYIALKELNDSTFEYHLFHLDNNFKSLFSKTPLEIMEKINLELEKLGCPSAELLPEKEITDSLEFLSTKPQNPQDYFLQALSMLNPLDFIPKNEKEASIKLKKILLEAREMRAKWEESQTIESQEEYFQELQAGFTPRYTLTMRGFREWAISQCKLTTNDFGVRQVVRTLDNGVPLARIYCLKAVCLPRFSKRLQKKLNLLMKEGALQFFDNPS